MFILPKVTYKFNAIPIKIPMILFLYKQKKQPENSYRTTKDPKQPKQSQTRRTKLETSQCLTSNYVTKLVIRIVQDWHKTRHLDQWKRIQNPEIHLCIYSQLIFDKVSKNTQWGKGTVSSTRGTGKTGYLHAKELNWTPILHHSQKSTQNGLKLKCKA